MATVKLTIHLKDGTDYNISQPLATTGGDSVSYYDNLCESFRQVQDSTNAYLTAIVEEHRKNAKDQGTGMNIIN